MRASWSGDLLPPATTVLELTDDTVIDADGLESRRRLTAGLSARDLDVDTGALPGRRLAYLLEKRGEWDLGTDAVNEALFDPALLSVTYAECAALGARTVARPGKLNLRLEIELHADGEETALKDRRRSIQTRPEGFDPAQDVAAVQHVEHVELALHPDLLHLELLGETDIHLVPALEILRAGHEQRHGDAGLRQRRGRIRRSDDGGVTL